MDKDKKPFNVIDWGKPDREPYEKEDTSQPEMWVKSRIPEGVEYKMTLIPSWETERMYKRARKLMEQDPNFDPNPMLKKLLFKYRKGIPKGSYRPPDEEGETKPNRD